MNPDERPVCDWCGYYNLPTEVYSQDRRLCRLCSNVNVPDEKASRVIRFVGNAILDQLGAFKKWQETHELIDEKDL